MEKYDSDIRFRRFKAISWPQIIVIIRLAVTVVSAFYLLSVLTMASVLAAILQGKQDPITFRLLLFSVFFLAVTGLVIACIVLFIKKKKPFIPLYMVIVGLCIVFYLRFTQLQYGLALVCVESFFITYMLTSKYMAVRFGFYNPLNRAALDAYAVRYDLGPAKEEAIRGLEDAATRHWRMETGPEEFAQQKRRFLEKL